MHADSRAGRWYLPLSLSGCLKQGLTEPNTLGFSQAGWPVSARVCLICLICSPVLTHTSPKPTPPSIFHGQFPCNLTTSFFLPQHPHTSTKRKKEGRRVGRKEGKERKIDAMRGFRRGRRLRTLLASTEKQTKTQSLPEEGGTGMPFICK